MGGQGPTLHPGLALGPRAAAAPQTPGSALSRGLPAVTGMATCPGPVAEMEVALGQPRSSSWSGLQLPPV